MTASEEARRQTAGALRSAAIALVEAAESLESGDDVGFACEVAAAGRVMEALTVLRDEYPGELADVGGKLALQRHVARVGERYSIGGFADVRSAQDVRRALHHAAQLGTLAPSSIDSLEHLLRHIVTTRLQMPEVDS